MTLPASKACSKCREIKPLDDFYRDKHASDGPRSECSECQRAYHETTRPNKEANAEKRRAYYAANKETIAKRGRAYREANKEVIAAKKRAYRAANKEVIAVRDRARRRTYRRALATRIDDEIEADRTRLRPDGLKRCRKCRENLDLSCFPSNRINPDGLTYECFTCNAARVAFHSSENTSPPSALTGSPVA